MDPSKSKKKEEHLSEPKKVQEVHSYLPEPKKLHEEAPVKKFHGEVVGAGAGMDFADLIKRLRLFIDFARHGDLINAAKIGMELALEFLNGINPMPVLGSEEAKTASTAATVKSLAVLCDDLEDCCNKLDTKTAKKEIVQYRSAEESKAAALAAEAEINPIISLLWPMLKVLIMKILERL